MQPYPSDTRGYGSPDPYNPNPHAPPQQGLAPTYHEPGANVPPGMQETIGPNGERGLISMGVGAASGWTVASHSGSGTFGKLLGAGLGMVAGQVAGSQLKKFKKKKKDPYSNREVDYYVDEHDREVSPPRSEHGYGGYGGHEQRGHSPSGYGHGGHSPSGYGHGGHSPSGHGHGGHGHHDSHGHKKHKKEKHGRRGSSSSDSD